MEAEPRTLIEQLEASASLPAGSNERFSGYGVMGLPFRSAHILAMRRFPASSVGPGRGEATRRLSLGLPAPEAHVLLAGLGRRVVAGGRPCQSAARIGKLAC